MLEELNKLNKKDIKSKFIEFSKYPNPIFRRKDFESLNGEWDFLFDPNDIGIKEEWNKEFPSDFTKIKVPYVYQTKDSGINQATQPNNVSDFVWYRRFINISNINRTYLLKFGAVDYRALVYVNGNLVGSHKGGFTPFSFDISNHLVIGKNEIVIKVEDFLEKEDILRGKQFWEQEPRSIWYPQSTGIWQNVWLERTRNVYIDKFKITPNLDLGEFEFDIENKNIKNYNNYKLKVEILFEGKVVSKLELNAKERNRFSINVLEDQVFNYNFHKKGRVWTPETPSIFDINFTLFDADKSRNSDYVQTYSAMRKIHTDNGIVYLNNYPYYQRLVLDQGYWPDSLMTGTSFQHLKDILLAKSLGFNGARKHEKVESVHYYYWADVIGFIVWAEIPSAIMYSDDMVKQSFNEWSEVIENYYNHPSIVAWLPLNESWGISNLTYDIKQLNYSLAIYHYTKSLDQTRLVVNNDGWQINRSDIVGVHNYNHGNPNNKQIRNEYKKMFESKENFINSMPAGRSSILDNYIEENYNKPFMLTEFGGISFVEKAKENWGYSTVDSQELYLRELNDIFNTVIQSPFIQGYCYTQLYDVEQETNGFLTYKRELKVEAQKIREINLQHKTIMKNKINQKDY